MKLFALGLGLLCAPAIVSAVVHLEYSSQLTGAPDGPYGFDGSTWSFSGTILDTTYTTVGSGYAAAYFDSFALTISGADAPYNGTYSWSGADLSGAVAVWRPNGSGSTTFMPLIQDSGNTLWLPLADGVSFATEVGATLEDAPAVGDSIEAADFDGIALTNEDGSPLIVGIRDADDNQTFYMFGDSVITATTANVPEPTTYAAFGGLAALGFIAWRRRRA
ncbi:MAG: hypothetical protein E1N59_2263 [Puniceicoccaceae bacterium 5H]|nr:MAG: hypothetical protein E1N59_2263 [Puniceicoccaceae bacterium 5H]